MFRINGLPLPDNAATGWCCGEVSLLAAIQHLDPASTITVDDILRATRKRPDFNTWPAQLVRARTLTPHLDYRIVRAAPEPTDMQAHIRQHHGIHADKIIAETAFDDMAEDVPAAQAAGLYDNAAFGLEDMRTRLQAGAMILAVVSWHPLYDQVARADEDSQHYVLLSGFDDHSMYVHDSGDDTEQFRAAAYRPFDNEKFLAAMAPENVYVAISKKVLASV